MEVVAVVAVRNACRHPFKHCLTQHDSRRPSDMGMHNIVVPHLNYPADPKREGGQVGPERANHDVPAQGCDVVAEARGGRPKRAKIEFELFAANMFRDLEQPSLRSAAWNGTHDFEYFDWVVAHRSASLRMTASEGFSAACWRPESRVR